jgi:hypothetical protein
MERYNVSHNLVLLVKINNVIRSSNHRLSTFARIIFKHCIFKDYLIIVIRICNDKDRLLISMFSKKIENLNE